MSKDMTNDPNYRALVDSMPPNHKELADKIVALGVGVQRKKPLWSGEPAYCPPGTEHGFRDEVFVNDPRVAMAMMEKCSEVHINCHLDQDMVPTVTARSWHGKEATARNRSRPLAINLACVEALDAD